MRFLRFTVTVKEKKVDCKKHSFSLHYLGLDKEGVRTGSFPNIRISFGAGR